MGPPCQFTLNKTPPARPNLGFTICLPTTYTFPLGSADSRVIFILNPPGQCSCECWSDTGSPRGHLRETRGLVLIVACLIRCPENEIRVTPIGICRHIGWLCWSCFTIVEMSCNRNSETDRVFPGEGISFVDHESL